MASATGGSQYIGESAKHRSGYVAARRRPPTWWEPEQFSGSAPRLDGSEDLAGGQARKIKPKYKTRKYNTSFLHILSLKKTVPNY